MKNQFQAFFERENTLALGVCNGCQMLSNLREIIPGTKHWPHFVRNRSEQFEARFVMVELLESQSVMLDGMAGTRIPVAIAHGEGRAEFGSESAIPSLIESGQLAMRYVDNYGAATESYPFNPNGSPEGVTGLCSENGRVTIMMPHPERVYRTLQNSWHPSDWEERAPWLRIFENARAFFK
ncbi:hypothetical protein A3760_28925 [Oleiphilus sp. HI0122]|nr:hypothetical protein A3760_28925 [Oleiphilus sp. HI0122]